MVEIFQLLSRNNLKQIYIYGICFSLLSTATLFYLQLVSFVVPSIALCVRNNRYPEWVTAVFSGMFKNTPFGNKQTVTCTTALEDY